ncbi:PP2C family protein-serine/threonine phosphatase, partial [Streptomyces sp. YGL11-2]|uniref:PP2C family protein-serine/threonine phosphatase n=1 Tax=Streptomyces sp. YGL11-2 TaxID=3414028 RepID=UPI003CE6B421
AATMGRLRTAVQNFSTLDLPPDELLAHLDDLVGRIDQDTATGTATDTDPDRDTGPAKDELTITGATCLYAIYDPTTGTCTMARAGHPPPAVVHPDGTVEVAELPAGPPLGVGGLPFEAAELRLPEGSSVVLYTDGLVEDRERDLNTGLEILCTALACPSRPPEEICDVVISTLRPARQSDDIA